MQLKVMTINDSQLNYNSSNDHNICIGVGIPLYPSIVNTGCASCGWR